MKEDGGLEVAAREKDETERQMMRDEALALSVELAETKAPARPRLLAEDVTPEKLALMLSEQGGRLALLTAEGGDVFEMIGGRYAANSKPNVHVLLKGHAGDKITVDRLGRPTIHVYRPALTIAMAVQPSVIEGLAEHRGFRDLGLLARFLWSLPKSTLGFRDVNADPVPETVGALYKQMVELLLRLPAPEIEDELHIDADAQRLYLEISGELEPELKDSGSLLAIKDWGSKLAGAIARLAGVLHAAEWCDRDPWARKVSGETMSRAILLGRYFVAHAQVAFGAMGASDEMRMARRIWRFVESRGLREFSKSDVWQALKGGALERAAALDPGLELLVEHRLIRLRRSTKPGPGRKPETYDVNPEAPCK